MHIIGRGNYAEANDAVRDILMLYFDLVENTNGFGHAANVHIRFDPLKFIDADVENDGYYYTDIDLLRAGSAIAILCTYYDLWCEEQSFPDHPRTRHYEAALAQGRLGNFPDIEAALRNIIQQGKIPLDDPRFDQALAPIYQKYVLGLFARLAQTVPRHIYPPSASSE